MKNRKRDSIIYQVAAMFLIGIIIAGLISYGLQRVASREDVKRETETFASYVADEVKHSILEYPAHEWLIKYWYEHYEEMDIEYDVDYSEGTLTEKKYNTWLSRHSDIPFRYATEEELQSLSDVDQKLYAEIAYSWLITRVNQIKAAYDVEFLFCVLPNESFDSQFFLFSAADPGAVRGSSYEEVYTLGVTVQVGGAQTDAMKAALRDSSHLAEAGDYVDYYSLVGEVSGRSILIGLTYDISELSKNIEIKALHSTELTILQQLILAAICLGLIYRFLLKPLKTVQKSIRSYTETKDSKQVAENLSVITAKNEIGRLSDDVTDMAKAIDDYAVTIEEITKERQRIDTELNLATRIQEDALPRTFPAFPDRSEIDIYASMAPAKEVGGDFYDFFFVDEDHLCMVIADVSGKGVPAALFMMSSKIRLGDNAIMGKTPAQILTDVNNAISENNRQEMFLTVWLGILEISTGKLTASNAGHEYPALMRANGEFELYRDKHGFVLGGMEGIHYKEYQLDLHPGDKLFLYTDGLPEATDANHELFGTNRMINALNKVKNQSPQGILEGVNKSVDEFVRDAEQFDDLTMMCLEYKCARR